MSGDFFARYGPWALVAGASEGLGAEYARQLAAHGLSLVLVARRAEALAALAAQLRAEHSVDVVAAAIDLADPALVEKVALAVGDREIGLVVYNAAASLIGRFLDHGLDETLRVVDVNCRGPIVLAHRFGGPMARRGRGGILLMSSIAASQGSAMIATYAATKAFNLVLAEGLWDELREHGVDVLACRPGATRTPAFEASKPAGNWSPMEPAPVVAAALAALGHGASVVPGWFNRTAAFVMGRLLPRAVAVRTMGRATRKMYGG